MPEQTLRDRTKGLVDLDAKLGLIQYSVKMKRINWLVILHL